MAKRALLVGCNYPGTENTLSGCANDVQRMHDVLVQKFGFDEADIYMMTDVDENHIEPTGRNIRAKLKELVRSSEEGDVLYFHFSGHGTQVPAETGDEEDDGLDEAICPTDLNILTDDDFRVIFKDLAPGVAFTFVSDSCHSGGLLDTEEVQVGVADDGEVGEDTEVVDEPPAEEVTPAASKDITAEQLQAMLSARVGYDVGPGTIRTSLFDLFGDDASSTVKIFVNTMTNRLQTDGVVAENLALSFLQQKIEDEQVDNDEYFRSAQEVDGPINRSGRANAKPENPEDRLPPSTGVLISGCQSNQTSADANPTGEPADAFGALSNAILTVLSRTEGSITNADLCNAVRLELIQTNFTQRPCLCCSEEAVDLPFICEAVC